MSYNAALTLTLEQTAEYLSLPLSMVYRMSSDGRLPGRVKWGQRTVRVDVAELDAYIEKMKGGGCDE